MSFPSELDQVLPLPRDLFSGYDTHSSRQVLLAPRNAHVNEMPVQYERLHCRAVLVAVLGRKN